MSRDYRNRGGGGGPQGSYGGGGGRHGDSQGAEAQIQVFFDPKEPLVKLVDALAEKQVEAFAGQISSSQIRKFFGDVKNQYRQFQSLTASAKDDSEKACIFNDRVAARFKMVRAKVAYAMGKTQGTLDRGFGNFLSQSIGKCDTFQDFENFVMHFEAVVAFIYGKGKASKS